MKNYPEQFGFIPDLRKCIGKTIKQVELLQMEGASTLRTCWIVAFTDGSRAYITSGPTGRLWVSPSHEAMQESALFTPEEVGIIAAGDKRKKDKWRRDAEDRDRREYERLRRRLGMEKDE